MTEVHFVTNNAIFYRFEATKRPKIARRAVQNLYGSPSKGVQKLNVPGWHEQRYKMPRTSVSLNASQFATVDRIE